MGVVFLEVQENKFGFGSSTLPPAKHVTRLRVMDYEKVEEAFHLESRVWKLSIECFNF